VVHIRECMVLGVSVPLFSFLLCCMVLVIAEIGQMVADLRLCMTDRTRDYKYCRAGQVSYDVGIVAF
jgi:hypothetical protein